jgi:NADH-quinone oxidoreductase subunit L
MDLVAVVGLITAFFAATIGLLQTDIKRVLAYSTVSQLGYMFLALGVGGFGAGIFHLMTHAFFKALLFLGAGSVIHALSGEQDMRRMGALARRIPLTHATFLVGALAIAGVPPLAGFFSKDEILVYAFQRSTVLFVIGLLTALMTAFYVFRAVFLTFHGTSRVSPTAEHHLHESPPIMTVPLALLALGSISAGWFPLDHWLGLSAELHIGHTLERVLMALSVLAGLGGISLAWWLYVKRPPAGGEPGPLYRLIQNKYYVDEIYGALIVRPLVALSTRVLWQAVDAAVIDGAVNGVGRRSAGAGELLRRLQSGNIRSYAGWVVIGAILALAFAGGYLAR